MSCQFHGDWAICDACAPSTDGRGFPHRSVSKGLTVYQRCCRCGTLTLPKDWVHDIAQRRFGCSRCYPSLEVVG